MTVAVLDSTFRLDSGRHALVANTGVGEVFFRVYDGRLRVNVEAYTVRCVDYQAIGDYGDDGVFRVHSVKKTDWTQPKRDATKAVHRTISEEIKGLLEAALEAGHIRRLERAADEWHAQDKLKRLERERVDLMKQLADLEAEHATTRAHLAQLQETT